MFSKRNIKFNLEIHRKLASHNKITSPCGLESVNYKASQLWENLSKDITNSSSLQIFKLKIESC